MNVRLATSARCSLCYACIEDIDLCPPPTLLKATALMEASRMGFVAMARWCVGRVPGGRRAARDDRDAKGRSCLLHACEGGCLDAVRFLAEEVSGRQSSSPPSLFFVYPQAS